MTDQALRKMVAHLVGSDLEMLGIHSGRFVRALDPEVITVQTQAVRVDGLLESGTGALWHLEFEMGEADAQRTIRHHMAVCDAHPGRPVHTVVFWGRRKSPKHVLQSGDLSLAVEEVLLARRQAWPEVERMERVVSRGEALSAADGFLLALVPLMDGARPLPQVVARGIAVAPALPEELRDPVLESMQALAYSRGDAAERAGIREVLRSMPLPQDLYEDLRKEFLAEGREQGRAEGRTEGRAEGRTEGRTEGELRQARAAVVEAFAAHFDAVPDAVQRAVSQAEDLDQLHRWHRAVVRARDEAEAQRAVLEG